VKPDALFIELNRVSKREKAGPAVPRMRRAKNFGGMSILQKLVRRMSMEAVGPQWIRGDKSMRVMVLVKATNDSEAGIMPTTELLEAMGKYNEELVNAGIMLAGEGLHPSVKGKRVAFNGLGRTIIDRPFAETRELIAGFWLWEVKNMAEAVEWVKRCPNPMPGPSEIEIRPVFEAADFGDALTPEVAEREDRLREKLAGR